ncbi:MAG: arsenate reductase ArsC [Methylovirgula sp.]
MPDRIFNVLFLCTGNSARSIMAEALLNGLGKGHFRAYSAGSHPKGEVHPLALKMIAEKGLPTEGLHPKSWDEFARPEAPKMDFVFTVCDNAANEACPVWPGHPFTAHWGIEDPVAVEGTAIEKERAFVLAVKYLSNRINAFGNLPIKGLNDLALQEELRKIGHLPGETFGHIDVSEK